MTSPSAEPPGAEKRPVVLLPFASESKSRRDVEDVFSAVDFVAAVLLDKGFLPLPFPVSPEGLSRPSSLTGKLLETKPLCVFNLFEGFSLDSGAEHRFRKLLEDLNLPCTGNPASVLKICLCKKECASFLKTRGIPVPRGVALYPGDGPEQAALLPFPIFLKPLQEDGSVGIDAHSLVHDERSLKEALALKLGSFSSGIYAEVYLPGREYSVACLGGDPCRVAGVSVIDYEEEAEILPFLDYGSKWEEDSPGYSLCPKKAVGAPAARAEELALAAGRALGCRGGFRVDLREKEGELFVLDVNPNPDMTPGGGFLRQCRESGLAGGEVILLLLRQALEYHKERDER
ncbi:MAG: D-alanine--D-alanine ligase [Synergistaceae bacterium]|nr:D-alanine--D-alanine ligase [Synergistaceae bacterium]